MFQAGIDTANLWERFEMNAKEIIKTFYEDVITNSKYDEIESYVADTSVVRIGNHVYPMGIQGMKEHLKATKSTYPDYSMKIIRQFQEENTVISEFIMTGTHVGEFLGITPTNKVITISGVDIDTVIDGRIVEHGGATNTFDAFWENQLIRPV